MSDRPEVIQALLDVGANIDAKDNRGWTPLHRAAANTDSTAIIQVLFDYGADSEISDNGGGTVLHTAVAYNNNPAVIHRLLYNGASIDAVDDEGDTPLGIAVRLSNEEVAEVLRGSGAQGYTNVQTASQYGSARDCPTGTTRQDWISAHYWYGVDAQKVRIEVLCGADVKARDVNGTTALHFAASYTDSPRVIQALLDNGAEILARNIFDYTPLHLAASLNHNPAVIQMLLDNGANAWARDAFGQTPLDIALTMDNAEAARVLWANGG